LSLMEGLVAAEGRAEGWEDRLRESLAPAFRIRRSDPTRTTSGKAEMIEDVRNGPLVNRQVVKDRASIDIDEHVAVAAAPIKVVDAFEESWFENTLVFERHDGKWVCTRWQSTRMPKPADIFCGDDPDEIVGIHRLFESPAGLRGSRIFFPPGTRTRWHTHGGTQVLFVTGGTGWLQRAGESEPVALHAAMCEAIKKEVPHWHGATADSWLEHVAITEGKTDPCEDLPCPELPG